MKPLQMMMVFSMVLLLGSTVQAAEAEVPAADPAAMQKMQALMSPGEAHKALEAFTGKWTYTGKFWMTPDSEAQEMTGTAVNEMIYGGRFLKQEFEGPWMGQTFNGLGFTGYDNIKGEYISIWIDSMATGIMTAAGDYNPDRKKLSLSGENSCPLTGEKDRKGRSDWTVTDADHNTYASYSYTPEGQEYKVMEINYTRAV